LKLKYDESLSNLAFKIKLRRYTLEMAKNTPYLRHTTFYERGLEWAERKKRALETSRKAKQDDAVRRCRLTLSIPQ
jgi:hypothetical protein